MIVFLVMHGASLTLTNLKGQTPAQLANSLRDSEGIEALQAVTEKPYPPSAPLVYLCVDDLLVVRWTHPPSRYGVPEPVLYELQGVKDNGEKVVLGEGVTDCSKYEGS